MARVGSANAKEKQAKIKNTAPPKQTGTDMQQHDSGCGTPASATDAGEFRYACPVCEGAVTSTVRTGQVWHRPCGRFRVMPIPPKVSLPAGIECYEGGHPPRTWGAPPQHGRRRWKKKRKVNITIHSHILNCTGKKRGAHAGHPFNINNSIH